jgi:hypothetical protein
MPTQSYDNHRHNPRPTGVGFLFVVVAIVGFTMRWFGGGRWTFALGLGGLIGAIVVLLIISRAYTTALQDRIIKLEMRLRSAQLLAPDRQGVLARLSKPQIVALRFASDEELPILIERAERENLTADQIKRAVKNWAPDWDRT